MVDAGQKVYRGEVIGDDRPLFYVTTATGTGVQVDGVDMVRVHDLLLPATRYVESRREAKEQIVTELIRRIGAMQAAVDTLRDEMLHEDLTQEVA